MMTTQRELADEMGRPRCDISVALRGLKPEMKNGKQKVYDRAAAIQKMMNYYIGKAEDMIRAHEAKMMLIDRALETLGKMSEKEKTE